jgi:hypothetical protein
MPSHPIEVRMKKNVLFVSLIAILAVNSLRAQMPGDKPAVVRLDPALDALVSAEAKLDLVKNDFGFTEGVVWVDEGKSGYLLARQRQGSREGVGLRRHFHVEGRQGNARDQGYSHAERTGFFSG